MSLIPCPGVHGGISSRKWWTALVSVVVCSGVGDRMCLCRMYLSWFRWRSFLVSVSGDLFRCQRVSVLVSILVCPGVGGDPYLCRWWSFLVLSVVFPDVGDVPLGSVAVCLGDHDGLSWCR